MVCGRFEDEGETVLNDTLSDLSQVNEVAVNS